MHVAHCKKGIVNSTSHLLFEFQVSEHNIGLGKLCSKTVLLCYAPMLLTAFITLHRNDIMPAYNIIQDQRLPCSWALTCHVSVGKHARLWWLHCCRCHHTDCKVSCSLIRLSRLQTVSPWCCSYVLTIAVVVNEYPILAKCTIILLTALLYASMCSYASTLLLCSKLCQHNSSRPNIVHAWTVNFENRLVKNPKHITQSPLNPNLTFIHLHHKQLIKNAKITHLHHKCLR